MTEKFLNRTNLIITTLTALLILVFKLWFEPSSQQIALETSKILAEKAKKDLEQSGRKFDNDFKFQIIDRVLAAVHNGKDGEVEVARSMVISMLSDDVQTQTQLLKAIEISRTGQGKTDTTAQKELGKINVYAHEEGEILKMVAKSPANGKSQKIKLVDVFYLEDTKENSYNQALQIIKNLKESGLYEQVRLRILPGIVNNRSGYQLSDNEIRYDGDELSDASNLLTVLQQKGFHYNLHQSYSNTPGYLSCFVVK